MPIYDADVNGDAMLDNDVNNDVNGDAVLNNDVNGDAMLDNDVDAGPPATAAGYDSDDNYYSCLEVQFLAAEDAEEAERLRDIEEEINLLSSA
eukprot:2795942-Heterocapsa_arctica.AAC.1